MPEIYGHRIGDAAAAELIAKLRARGTTEAAKAAEAIGHTRTRRDATAEESLQERNAIMLELDEWENLDATAPALADLRDRLSGRTRRVT